MRIMFLTALVVILAGYTRLYFASGFCIEENSLATSLMGKTFQDDMKQAVKCWSSSKEYEKPWVAITGADWGYRGVLFNWILHMERISRTNYVILCYDERTYQAVGSLHGVLVANCNTVDVHRGANGIRTSVEMTQKMLMKHVAIWSVLQEEVIAVWSDVDALWLEDFMLAPTLSQWSVADIVGTMGTYPDSVFRHKGVSLCTGLFAVFPSSTSLAFYSHVLTAIRVPGRYQSDQLALNELLEENGTFQYLLTNMSLADALKQFDLPFKHFDNRRYDKSFLHSRQLVDHGVLFSNPPVGVVKIGLLPFTKFPREKTRFWKSISSTFEPSIYHMFSMKNGTKKVQEFQHDGVFLLGPGWESSSPFRDNFNSGSVASSRKLHCNALL